MQFGQGQASTRWRWCVPCVHLMHAQFSGSMRDHLLGHALQLSNLSTACRAVVWWRKLGQTAASSKQLVQSRLSVAAGQQAGKVGDQCRGHTHRAAGGGGNSLHEAEEWADNLNSQLSACRSKLTDHAHMPVAACSRPHMCTKRSQAGNSASPAHWQPTPGGQPRRGLSLRRCPAAQQQLPRQASVQPAAAPAAGCERWRCQVPMWMLRRGVQPQHSLRAGQAAC